MDTKRVFIPTKPTEPLIESLVKRDCKIVTADPFLGMLSRQPISSLISIDVPDDYVSGSTFLYIHGGGDLMSWNELGGKGRSLFGMSF